MHLFLFGDQRDDFIDRARLNVKHAPARFADGVRGDRFNWI
jgi:hypothetical protein